MTCRNTKILLLTSLVFTGSCGIAYAESDYRDVVRDTEGQIVHLNNGTCVRTKWIVDHDLCEPTHEKILPSFRLSSTPSPVTRLSQEERTVYFKFNGTGLSAESMQRLDTLAQVLQSNASIKEANIIGYADRIGGISYNQHLSQKRAETVRNYLITRGYTRANVTETRWVGKSEPITSCSNEVNRTALIRCLHNDRRVEVDIRYEESQLPPDNYQENQNMNK